jgi:ketosteroid isomerase-like protein
MSQENAELHYRCLDAFNRRDLDAFLTLMDDDVEAVPRASAMEGESSYRRHEGLRRWWNNVLDVIPDWNIEVLAVRDLGDLTVADLFVHGHGAGSGAPMNQATWQMARWRRGKCVWWRFFETRAEGLEAVGLSEQDAHAAS